MARRCELCGGTLPVGAWLSRRAACDPCLQRREAARLQAKEVYRRAILQALRDAVITPQEWEQLAHLRAREGVLPLDAFHVHKEVFAAGHAQALQDRTVTPDELRYLRSLAQQLRLPEAEVAQSLSEATRLHQLYYLEYGALPSITNVPINLQRGELCHWVEPNSVYIEERTERVRVSGSAGYSFRICKGLRYRIGASRGYSYQVPVNVPADQGFLVITNKRIAFLGGRKSFSLPHSKILAFQPFENAVQIQKDGVTAKPQVFTVQDAEAVAIVLTRAAEAALG